jgi:hypothetical protein
LKPFQVDSPAARIAPVPAKASHRVTAIDVGVGFNIEHAMARPPAAILFVNRDLSVAKYRVHTDIPHQDVGMKAKGVGELGICGSLRRLPTPPTMRPACGCARAYLITLDKFLDRLPAVG